MLAQCCNVLAVMINSFCKMTNITWYSMVTKHMVTRYDLKVVLQMYQHYAYYTWTNNKLYIHCKIGLKFKPVFHSCDNINAYVVR